MEFQELNLKVLQGNDGIYGIRHDNTRVQTSKINKFVENTALDNIDKERELIDEINEAKTKMSLIDAAVSKLEEVEKNIVMMRCFQNQTWIYVSDEVMYSERMCKYKFKDALANLAIIFYGEKALEEIEIKQAI